MKYLYSILGLIAICMFLNSCYDKNSLTLSKFKIKKSYDIDTIESYPDRNMAIIGIQINHALGKFEYYLGVVKRSDRALIVYKIEKHVKTWQRISPDYIASVNPYDKMGWGWFKIDEGRMQNPLPDINGIMDSLKLLYPKDFFIRNSNGFIDILSNGELVKSFNYGEFVTKYKNLSFDSLHYKLYKLEGDSLIVASKNGNDLLKQKNGIYFIPPPGHGIIAKFNKREIIDLVDSVSKLSSPPRKLRIKSVQ